MTDGRRDGPRPSAGDDDLSGDALRALLRDHGVAAPYDRVDWTELGQRIVASGRDELASRHGAVVAIGAPRADASNWWSGASGAMPRVSSGGSQGTTGHIGAVRRPSGWRWWEVTAGWARPTIAAAVIVSAVSAALALGSPATSGAESGDAANSAWAQNLAGNSGAVVVDRAAGVVLDPTAGAAIRDSLLSAVVEQ